MTTFNPYLLITPAVMAALGIALVCAWNFDRRQRGLGWMAVGMLATSIALAVQSVLSPAQIGHYAIYTAVFYLAGAWLAGLSIADKFQVPYHPRLAALISVLTWCAIFYYSRLHESLAIRAYLLSLGLGCLHILPVFNVLRLRHQPQRSLLDTLLYWTYLVFGVYTVLRPITLWGLGQHSIDTLVQSAYWFVTLLGSILFCMAFAFLMLASAIRHTLSRLHAERDLDPLTHLLNRRAFQESVDAQMRQAPTGPAAIVMGDLDFFKQINDTWGHGCGDQVLRHVAACLRHSTRSQDVVARYGGEEFVLLLPHTSQDSALQITQRIQAALAADPFQLPNQQRLTMSFGITALQPHEAITDAIARADRALYQAKQAGRDRISLG